MVKEWIKLARNVAEAYIDVQKEKQKAEIQYLRYKIVAGFVFIAGLILAAILVMLS